ncbi:CwfJ-like family protein [Actinidia rufa]|uniref:CwfJ-like family protein n=1 Tax=Actinidia rufa TaxID=165716 RepID=A0A7J0FIF3_9ERIC|nr:CwfJ-like family protein [Actinidia rufa]
MKPTNTTLCPFTSVDKAAHTDGAAKRPIDKAPESQYWRYDVSQKRQRHGDTEGNKLCFKFLSTGSCARGEKCHFQHDGDAREQCSRGVCFDFLNKGKCERGPDCNFKHSLQDEDKSFPNRRRGSGNTSTNTDRSSDCWFCLSSFSLESHLITSIGEHYYCALAKGPLVEDHVLIIPIEHTPTTLSSSSECEPELIRFQNSLKKYFKNQEKEVVFFEWFSTRGTHANLQVIPIPSSRASVVKDIFNLAAQKLGFKFTEIKKLPGDTILYHSVEENETFPAQFGREVLAGLLNMADRADWKNCKLGKEEETKMAENFKNRPHFSSTNCHLIYHLFESDVAMWWCSPCFGASGRSECAILEGKKVRSVDVTRTDLGDLRKKNKRVTGWGEAAQNSSGEEIIPRKMPFGEHIAIMGDVVEKILMDLDSSRRWSLRVDEVINLAHWRSEEHDELTEFGEREHLRWQCDLHEYMFVSVGRSLALRKPYLENKRMKSLALIGLGCPSVRKLGLRVNLRLFIL